VLRYTTPPSVADVEDNQHMKLGDVVCLYSDLPLHSTRFPLGSRLFVMLALVPWFLAPRALVHAEPLWINTICCYERHFDADETTRTYLPRLFQATGLFAVDRRSTVAARICDVALVQQGVDDVMRDASQESMRIYSFALRWHMLSHGHTDAAAAAASSAGLRRSFNSFSSSSSSSSALAVTPSVAQQRESARNNALNTRSMVYFTRTTPRRHLFQSRQGFASLVRLVRSMVNPILAKFVVRQLLDVICHIIDTEVRGLGDLALYRFMDEFLVPFVRRIEESERLARDETLAFLRDSAPAGADPTVLNAQLFVNTQPLESFELMALRAADLTDVLSGAELDYLCAPDEDDAESDHNDDDDDADADRMSEMDRHERTISTPILSLSVFGHNAMTQAAFVCAPGGAGKLNSYVLRKGRCYMRALDALNGTLALIREFLMKQCCLDENRSASESEALFEKSVPFNGLHYDAARRLRVFDDAAIDSDEFRALKHLYIRTELGALMGNTAACAPLRMPDSFDAAAFRHLAQNRDGPSVPTSASRLQTMGIVRQHDVAEAVRHGVKHRDACFAPPPVGHIRAGFEMRSNRVSEAVCLADGDDFRSQIADIEDVVDNMHSNRALPPCLARVVKPVLDGGYLKHEDRKLAYRMLRADNLVTRDQALRFMMRSSGRKFNEHQREAASYETLCEKSHTKAATAYKELAESKMRAVTDEIALEATTCAPSCSSMMTHRGKCPYTTLGVAQLDTMLAATGISDAPTRAAILAQESAQLRCRMQFEASRPQRAHIVPAFDESVHEPVFKHPLQYSLAAADHLARSRQANAGQ
jgi:hypothetical protein